MARLTASRSMSLMPHQENATTHHEITRKHEEHKKDLFWHRDVRGATWDVRRCELRRARREMRATRRKCARGAHGNNGGGTRFFVACSNAYASSISFGSLHAIPVKLTPYGVGLALKPAGNAGAGAFGTNANGTMTVG